MDLKFITDSLAYRAMLANPEVHLEGYNNLRSNEIKGLIRFTRETLTGIMKKSSTDSESELIAKLERTLLQDLDDAMKEEENANGGAVGEPNTQ
ncbi:unnamed protein product [Rodentolepis nana]|uniref:Uncharacterized protein n=1 Tax=Rodentolepis nana TaxID=102285 RepID=A0A0R3TTX1_RODNA|nr:unnamed protein product [Rodentolepis nana]